MSSCSVSVGLESYPSLLAITSGSIVSVVVSSGSHLSTILSVISFSFFWCSIGAIS